MAPTALVVLTTLANDADARALVTALVAARLVACGTLLPGARSIYRWEGQVTEEGEVVVLLKTDASRWEALCAAVRERHPYQVPELLALLVERAGLLAGAAHYRAAQADYERALRVDPIQGQALTGLGVVLSRRGLWSEAVPHLRRASEVDPGRAAAWFYLGEALNHVDELDGAQAAYERAVELEPRNARALYGLGIVLDRLNRPDDATRMYRRSREAAGR